MESSSSNHHKILCDQFNFPEPKETIVHSKDHLRYSLDHGKHSLHEQLCHVDSDGTAWLVIQRRGLEFHHANQRRPENFNASWNDYKHGFGDLNGEFWYGNDLLNSLTHDDDIELRIIIENWNGTIMELEYGLFRIDSEQFNYNLMIGEPKFDNETLDSMSYHNNQGFSTFDRRNDKAIIDKSSGCCSCAVSYGSGWWFNK